MRILADWYPGDGAVFAAAEMLGMITIIVAMAWVAERLLARDRPALRNALWLSALGGVLVTPVLVLLGPQLPWRFAMLSPEHRQRTEQAERKPLLKNAMPTELGGVPLSERSAAGSRAPESSEVLKVTASARKPAAVLPNTRARTAGAIQRASRTAETDAVTAGEAPVPAPNVFRAFASLALAVWSVGSVYLGLCLLVGWRRLHRVRHRLRPFDVERWRAELTEVSRVLAMPRLPTIWLSPDVRTPLVAGLWPAVVILPEGLPESSSSRQVREILVHECAHLLHHDPWTQLLERIAIVLFWIHPFCYLLSRRLDQAREEVCDNHVLAHMNAHEYAETLFSMAQICYPVPGLEGHLMIMPRGRSLENRLAGLLSKRRDPSTSLSRLQRVAVLMSLGLMLVLIPSFGFRNAAVAENSAAANAVSQDEKALQAAENKTALSAATLHGTVLADNGSPAAGAVVWAAKVTFGPLERRETIADSRGRYALDLDPGEWFVWARLGTQGAGGSLQHVIVTIVANRTPVPVVMRMEERGTFRGKLLEAETGKPIVGGRLFLDAGLFLTTDKDGRFEMGGLSRSDHEAFVVASGRVRMRVLFDTTLAADTQLDVSVPQAGKLVGRVTDTDGKPIPGAYVGRGTSGSYFSTNGLYVACDADGRFEYDDAVPPDPPTRLTAGAPGYQRWERDGFLAPPHGKPLEVNFRLRPKPEGRPKSNEPAEERRRFVSGVVRGPDAKPLAGITVRWGYQPYVDAIQMLTDADGRFRLSVPDRPGILAVLAREFTPEFPAVSAGDDQTVDVKLSAGHTARGHVVDDTGKPIKDVRVIAVIPSPDPRIGNPYWISESEARSDANGYFELKGVPGRARFDFLQSSLSAIRNHSLELDGPENRVTMQYGGAISGRVLDRDGKPIRSFRVLVSFPRERRPGDQSGGFFAGYMGIGVRFTSPDGRFILTGIGAGTVHRIMVLAEGHGEAVADRVTAMPLNRLGNTENVTLRAGPPVHLRVRAVSEKGRPVAGARVALVHGEPGLDRSFSWGDDDAGWQHIVRRRTGTDGWADFPALSFAEGTVLVQAPGYARHRVGWRDRKVDLRVAMSPEAVLTGEVYRAAGEPVRAFYVNLMSTPDPLFPLQSGGDQVSASRGPDDEGRFRITELPWGNWSLTIRDPAGGSTLCQERLELGPGETKHLKIEVKKK
jgi:beta-lactamase regulating signal transducer with metallopeptidase domain/protocatechuate 3,4-dioxygenase beta subunit